MTMPEIVAKLASDTLEWAASQAELPAFGEVRREGTEVTLKLWPSGERFRLTVERID